MVCTRRRLVLLPALLAAVGLALLCRGTAKTFIAAGRQPPRASSQLRATEMETETKAEEEEPMPGLPKPDMRLLTRTARIGQTYDQDKKGNQWVVDSGITRKETDEDLPAIIYIPVAVVLTLLFIAFADQLTGNDPRFGGALGDGAFSVGN